jgi:hypothetical protein
VPTKSKPAAVSKPAVSQPAAKPAATVTQPAPVRTTPVTPVRTTPAPAPARAAPTQTTTRTRPARKTTHHKKKPARRKHREAAPAKHRPVAVAAVSMPRLTPVRLVAPANTDGGRARKLALGALGLLGLALASSMLLAFTARVERQRVAR